MKTRTKKHATDVQKVDVQNAARIVTLTDPRGSIDEARGAYVRLRPPADCSADVIATWRDAVNNIARAVRVLASQHSMPIPAAAMRPDALHARRSFADTARQLAREVDDHEVLNGVVSVLEATGE